jgi:TonB family protein
MARPVNAISARSSGEFSILPTIAWSLGFHILAFVVIPLSMNCLWQPKRFMRPQTFQLVSLMQRPMPTRAERSRPAAKAESAVRPATARDKTAPAKPVPKPEPQEDLGELEDLLGGLPQPVSSVNFGNVFPYSWYERSLMMKVEQNWKPAYRDTAVSVVVSFTIFTDGNISPVAVSRGSGNGVLDKQAVRAIELAAPFGKLPPAYTGDLEINYTLRPTSAR